MRLVTRLFFFVARSTANMLGTSSCIEVKAMCLPSELQTGNCSSASCWVISSRCSVVGSKMSRSRDPSASKRPTAILFAAAFHSMEANCTSPVNEVSCVSLPVARSKINTLAVPADDPIKARRRPSGEKVGELARRLRVSRFVFLPLLDSYRSSILNWTSYK